VGYPLFYGVYSSNNSLIVPVNRPDIAG